VTYSIANELSGLDPNMGNPTDVQAGKIAHGAAGLESDRGFIKENAMSSDAVERACPPTFRGAAESAGVGGQMACLVRPTSSTELDHVRSLLRQFQIWHSQRHRDDVELIDRYFSEPGFEEELHGLPGLYAAPRGRLLAAYRAGQPVGCAAMRDLGHGVCEIRRMFVPADFRGLGIGSALTEQMVSDAIVAGYRRLRLDTSNRHAEAIRLFESAGFRRARLDQPMPWRLESRLVSFELAL
jgi:ribosomal protein S18 acetylase RimI-like enzyme